jgi:putative ABC transport system permease protein
VAIISYSLWQNRFAGDAAVVGRSIGLNGASATIVGVMPAGFDFPGSADIWTPRVFENTVLTRVQIEHGAGFLRLFGRLKNGVDKRQALAEFTTLAEQYKAAHAGFGDAGNGVRIRTLREGATNDIRTTLLVLWGAVGFVLLIAAANVANLLLARAIARRKEIAIRASLGATRGRLLGQFLTESVILSTLGAALGILLAEWSVRLLTRLDSRVLPRAGEIQIDGRVLLFTLAVAIVSGVLFGLGPALHSLRIDLSRALKETSRGVTGGGRLRGFMVIAEVALAMILLAGAGLLMRSFSNLEKVDPGFRPQHLLSMSIALAPARYPKPFAQAAFFDQVLARVSTLPGVDRATVTSCPPIAGGYCIGYIYWIAGRPAPEPSKIPVAFLRSIHPQYFDTMRIPLIEGRAFSDADSADAPRVAIINQTMARRQWPNEDPIGRRFSYSREQVSVEVVGVAADVKFNALGDATAYDEMYVPFRQRPWLTMTLLVRGSGDAASLTSSIRHEIARIDSDQPVANVQTMEDALSDSVARPRLETALMGGFAALALLLAAVGIFGVVAWSVSQRTNEIGIRMALGARPANVLAMIVGQAFRTIGVGQVIGLSGGLALTRLLGSALFGVSADDPLTFAAGMIVLAAVALLACVIAARRAILIDPVIALRQD